MKESDIAYARGNAVLTRKAGVPAALVRDAARLAPDGERPALFGPGEFEMDGWRIDAAGEVWTPPVRERPFDPVRPSSADADAEVSSAPSGATAPRTGGGQSSSPVDLGAQRAAAARLTNAELRQRIMDSDRWQRWCRDPKVWTWRWDRRALYLGRALP